MALLTVERKDMPYDEKALEYLMFLKAKHDRTIKVWGCAHSWPQRLYTTKKGKIQLEYHLKRWCCPAQLTRKKTGMYVMVINIPGTFIYMDMEGTIHMLLEGEIIKLIVKSIQEHMTNTYGILTKGRLWCMYNSKMHFTELYKWRSYSGSYNPTHNRRGDSRLLIRTDVWQTKQSSRSNLLLYGSNNLQISHVDQAVVKTILKNLQANLDKIAHLQPQEAK